MCGHMLGVVRFGGNPRIAPCRGQCQYREIRVVECVNGIVGCARMVRLLAKDLEGHCAGLNLKPVPIVRPSG